jgi:hypothetical protein
MSEKAYICHSCETAFSFNRARVHCLVCPDYNSCADCHVTESVSGTHHTEHDYEVYRQGGRVLARSKSIGREGISYETPIQISVAAPYEGISQIGISPETYWGTFITPTETLSPIFSRLITAIFAHFDAASAVQEGSLCAFARRLRDARCSIARTGL